MSYYLIVCLLLENHTFIIRYGIFTPLYYQIKASVLQGSILSPDLFNVYIADIPKTPNTIFTTYQDDTAILSSEKDLVKTEKFLKTKYLNLINDRHKNRKLKSI